MTVHIIGTGLAGLAAAIHLIQKGRACTLYEAAPQAGGRCRSFYDAQLGCWIDNGNHLLIGANIHAIDFLDHIGASTYWRKQDDYAIACLQRGTKRALVQEPRLLLQSAFNTPLSEMAYGFVLRAMLLALRGGITPYMASAPLQQALIAPALAALERAGVVVQYQARLTALHRQVGRVRALEIAGRNTLELGDRESVILAVTAQEAQRLVPELVIPAMYEPIINGHFACDLPGQAQGFYGCAGKGAIADWIFVKGGHISTTTSAASRLMHLKQHEIAQHLWQNVQARLSLEMPLPSYRIITEKRATFRCTRSNLRARPQQVTMLSNLFLAGDYVQSALPACIEGAISSGQKAATLAIQAHYATSEH